MFWTYLIFVSQKTKVVPCISSVTTHTTINASCNSRTHRLYCDFVVWAEANLHIERIIKDELILKEIIPRAEKFFKLCVLPELLGKWFTRSHGCQMSCYNDPEIEEDSGTWCYCKLPKGGDMVCCENKFCCIKWFHLECLQMVESPCGK